jgi:glycosyltransferase involved in cell wall biosynthesis
MNDRSVGMRQPEEKLSSVRIVRHRWDLHSEHAGYDRLFEHVNSTHELQVASIDQSLFCRVALTFPHQVLRIGKYLAFGRVKQTMGILNEVARRYAWTKSPPDIIHLAAVDALVGTITTIRERFPSTLILGTVHLPPSNWRKEPSRMWNSLGLLDAVIVLSSDQKQFFEQELRTTKIILVPHGVDVQFFRPGLDDKRSDDQPRVVFAGIHLRDFDLLWGVISHMVATYPGVCFDLVLPAELVPSGLLQLSHRQPSRITIHNRVSSLRLRELYQRAHVAWVPLKDVTASNSIMEALACGLPVVTTDVGGMKDYISKECGFLVPPRYPRLHAEYLMTVVRDPEIRMRMGKAARARAEQLSWQRIAQEMTQVYLALLRDQRARSGSAAIDGCSRGAVRGFRALF